MKRTLCLILSALMIVTLLAACGGSAPAAASSAAAAESGSQPAADASSAAAGDNNKLIVGLDDQFPPMGFRNDKNEIVGFDVELAQTVGKRLGMEVVLTPIDWTTKELELNGGKVNVLWNGLTITDERKESMLMSPAYLANAQVIVVQKDSDIHSLKDLAGKVVGLQDTSSADDAYAQCSAFGTESQLVKAADNVSLFNDLKIGRIDAVVIDKVFADYYITENGEGKLRTLDDQLADEEYGIAFKKGNTELADKVLTELAAMVKDGTAAEISKKWFGEDRVIFKYSK